MDLEGSNPNLKDLESKDPVRGVPPTAPARGLLVAQDGYECGPTQNHKFT